MTPERLKEIKNEYDRISEADHPWKIYDQVIKAADRTPELIQAVEELRAENLTLRELMDFLRGEP